MVLTDKGIMIKYLILSVVLLIVFSIMTTLSYNAAATDSLFQQTVDESSILNKSSFKLLDDKILRSNLTSHDMLLTVNSIIDISTDKPRFPQEIRRNTTATNNSLHYKNLTFGIEFQYPSDWSKVEGENNVSIYSPLENNSDSFQENFLIEIKPFGNLPLEELVSLEIIEYRQNNSEFRLLDSSREKIAGKSGYKIVYEYRRGEESYKVMELMTIVGGKSYLLKYTAESESYLDYLPTIRTMTDSIYVQELPIQGNGIKYPELSISSNPFDIVINHITNRLYITNLYFGTVSVIDGLKDRLIADIKVRNFPTGLSVDPELNKIYVANSRSDTVSVIDGSTNTVVDEINVGNKPRTLAIDTTEKGVDSLVFVANFDSDTVSVIYAPENRVKTNLPVGDAPSFLTVNPITNRLYVTNQDSNTVSMIDYFISDGGRFENTTAGSDIRVGRSPSSIALNSFTNKLFVTNSDSNTVSVIDGSTNTVEEIPVGIYPYHLAVNPDTNLIYVANYVSGTVSVIDGSTNTVVKEIPVGSFPVTVSRNPVTNIVYVSNLGSNTISEIENTSIVAGITFNISPSDSGFIECNGMKISDSNYIRYNISLTTNINCKASANSDSVFRSWTSDLPFNSTSTTEMIFRPSKYGNVTGNFVPQLFTDEYWDELRSNLLNVMLPIMTAVIGGYFIPNIARWLNSYRQRGYLRRIIITITAIHDTSYRNGDEYLKRFEETRRRIDELLTEGKISEQQYGILNDKISEYEDDIGKS